MYLNVKSLNANLRQSQTNLYKYNYNRSDGGCESVSLTQIWGFNSGVCNTRKCTLLQKPVTLHNVRSEIIQ
jgi:hypothetical protein